MLLRFLIAATVFSLFFLNVTLDAYAAGQGNSLKSPYLIAIDIVTGETMRVEDGTVPPAQSLRSIFRLLDAMEGFGKRCEQVAVVLETLCPPSPQSPQAISYCVGTDVIIIPALCLAGL